MRDVADTMEKGCGETKGNWYKSLLKDDGFSDLNVVKVRRLVGLGLAEMLATATFVALGCGNVVNTISGADPSLINTVISFAFGISTSVIIFGPISGALMNPALNLTAIILGHMSLQKCLFYTIFQLFGGYLGVSFVRMVSPNIPDAFCVTLPNPDVGVASAFMVEFLGTALLAWVFCNILDPRMKELEGIIFLKFLVMITAYALPATKYGGCSINPARSFGPALAAGHWEYHWIYWGATCGGAVFAGTIYRLFFDDKIYQEKEEASNPN